MQNNDKKKEKNFDATAYKNQWAKEHDYKQINLKVKQCNAEYIKNFADMRNMSVSGAILAALQYIDDNGIDITPFTIK